MRKKLIFSGILISLFAVFSGCSTVYVKIDNDIQKNKQISTSIYVFPIPKAKMRLGFIMSRIDKGKKAEENYSSFPMKEKFLSSMKNQSALVASTLKLDFNSKVQDDLHTKFVFDDDVLDLSSVASQIKTDYLLTYQILEYGNLTDRANLRARYTVYDVKKNEAVWMAISDKEVELEGFFSGESDNAKADKVYKALETAINLSVKDVFESLAD